jgi:hypothetical protein
VPSNPVIIYCTTVTTTFNIVSRGKLFTLGARTDWPGMEEVFPFSGHSLCRWPPPHHKQRGGCLQFAQTWPNCWQLCHCVSPFWALYASTLIVMWQRLAVCPDVAQLLAVMALHKPTLSSIRLHPDCDVAEACSLPRRGRTAGSYGTA